MVMGSLNGALTVVDQAQSRANLGLGDVALLNLPITNGDLQNSSVTINTSGTLSGGGSVSLGGTLNLVGSGGTGDVVGPSSAVNNNFASYNGTTGKLIKDSGFTDTSFLKVANNLNDVANAASARTNLGLGTAAVQADTFFNQVANNLSDVANAATARTNLGLAIGTNVQAWDADLDAIAALSGTAGYLAKTAANTWALRTLTAGVGMAITNGNGTVGNPSLSITGGLVLISSQTAANVASIIFTGLTTYNMYKLYIHRAQPATNAQPLRVEISQDNGSTWLNSGYSGGIYYHAYNSTSFTNSNSTAIFPISGPCSNGDSMTGELFMGSLSLPDYFTINGLATWTDTTLSATASGWIGGRGATGVNALRLTFASGNINSGSFTLFGIKTA